jgi:Leucine Rich repeats (2 copies)
MSETSALGTGFVQPLRLDPADVKAIRNSWPGRFLGLLSAVCASVLLVLAYLGLIDQALKRLFEVDLSQRPFLHYSLLGSPGLVLLAYLCTEALGDRRRRAAQKLAIKIGAIPSGYFRIGPYLDTPDDRQKFDRADKAHEKVLAWLLQSSDVPLYLTGESGSGKSSLLDAFVLPTLRDRGWLIIKARAWQDPLDALRNVLAASSRVHSPDNGGSPDLRGLLETAARRSQGRSLVVLDQFEEFVILGSQAQQETFAALVAELQARPITGFLLLLVLRRDYEDKLHDIGLPPLRQNENWYPVGGFTLRAASTFMKRSDIGLQVDSLERLLNSATELDDTPGMVRPVTLNVIGYVLSEGPSKAPSLNAASLVRSYIAQAVEQPNIRDRAPAVLDKMITGHGTKRPCSEQELASDTGLRRGEIRAVMNGLVMAGLARPLDATQVIWELSHDFVARALTSYLGRRRRHFSRRVASSATPALLILTLAAALGIIGWEKWNASEAESSLAELGILFTSSGDELSAEINSNFDSALFAQSGLLFRKLAGRIRTLNLSNGAVERLDPLSTLTALRTLDVSGTHIADLTPLKSLRALQRLNLSRTPTKDLGFLNDLPELQELDLSDTRVGHLDQLKDLTALQTLDLSDTQVTDLEPLKGLTALRTLTLNGTRVVDLDPLRDLKTLQTLSLERTGRADTDPVQGVVARQGLATSSLVDQNVDRFQRLADSDITYVLTSDGNLRRDFVDWHNPKKPPQHVDGNVFKFKAVDAEIVYVVGSDGILWREFNTWDDSVRPRQRLDGNVQEFQALNNDLIYVLGSNGVLWREFGGFLTGRPREAVDSKVVEFQALDRSTVFVLDQEGILWREVGSFAQGQPRYVVDSRVAAFQALDENTVFVLDTGGNLWRESGSSNNTVNPRVQIDRRVRKFLSLAADIIYVLDAEGLLWRDLLAHNEGAKPRVKLDEHISLFQALDAYNLVVLSTDGNLWREYLPGH